MSRRWASSSANPAVAVVKENGNEDGSVENDNHTDDDTSTIDGGTLGGDAAQSVPENGTCQNPVRIHPLLQEYTSESAADLRRGILRVPERGFLPQLRLLPAREKKKLRYRLYIQRKVKGLERRRALKRDIHWTELIDLLEVMSRMPREVEKEYLDLEVKEIFVPEETLANMVGMSGMQENIFYVHIENECQVRVMNPVESNGIYRKVILTGSEGVTDSVESLFLRMQELQASGDPSVKVRKPLAPFYPSRRKEYNKKSTHLIRSVWDTTISRKPMFLQPFLTSPPVVSDAKQFTEFVEDLVNSQRPYPNSFLARKFMYPHLKAEWRQHYQVVAKVLVSLFELEENQKSISTGALNMALSFLYRHELNSTAKRILASAQKFATVDTFNIILQAAAVRQDLAMFSDYLRAMAKSNLRPNISTWAKFVDCVIFPPAKKYLVTRLISSGLINDEESNKCFVFLTLEDTFRAHLQSGQSVDAYFDKLLDKEAGANIFVSGAMISRMCNVIVALRDFIALKRLFEITREKRWPVGEAAISDALSLFFFYGDAFGAVEFILRCMRDHSFRINPVIYEKLFIIAYREKCYNICRVLWRYACITGDVTYKMKQCVYVSLNRNVTFNHGWSDDDIWNVSAGKVIVGLEMFGTLRCMPRCPTPKAIREYIPETYHEYPLGYLLTGYKPNGPERVNQLRLASALIKRDIEAGKRLYVVNGRLSVLLDAALIIDMQWEGIQESIHWKIENAIGVRLNSYYKIRAMLLRRKAERREEDRKKEGSNEDPKKERRKDLREGTGRWREKTEEGEKEEGQV